MKVIVSKNFSPTRAWEALDIANFDGTSVRLHWTDKSYRWHINEGEEVFVVLNGVVEMHYRDRGEVYKVRLSEGDIFFASVGTEHVAHPQGAARVLVIEKEDSD
jgi:mannose-6-phosphate isomerase-like protein (cupin superfamily)